MMILCQNARADIIIDDILVMLATPETFAVVNPHLGFVTIQKLKGLVN
jgi:hypothetical protein